ncbi:TPA: hypothetical protein KON86_002862 [Clostridioides difficile]|nr:hypothetical protein [Clostridioides difficile]HBF4443230.1 hypothetical protein [Clostridioides difficile]HBG1420764.1 hypothetical protein [Clostridioides difficile]HEK4907943.1 hypothetical protein [Clostridioides difficile]
MVYSLNKKLLSLREHYFYVKGERSVPELANTVSICNEHLENGLVYRLNGNEGL